MLIGSEIDKDLKQKYNGVFITLKISAITLVIAAAVGGLISLF